MIRLGIAAVAAGLLAGPALIGCSSHVTPAASAARAPVGAAATPGPIPAAAVRHLPPGVFYLLAGRRISDTNVWQVGPGGRETQLTHNPPGFGISAFAASRAGIILADARYGVDDLARWTRRGASWLRPRHARKGFILGSVPDVGTDGRITYETMPVGVTKVQGFTIWSRRSFTGRQEAVFKRRADPGNPALGPRDQIAIVGVGRKQVIIVSRRGKVRSLRTRFSLGYPPVWGERAPALAVSFKAHAAELFFPGGRREQLPGGWHPLAWSPAGGKLLMQSGAALGIWSMSAPRQVVAIGKVRRGFQLVQASWLDREAPM
jgi:hypothetical protein